MISAYKLSIMLKRFFPVACAAVCMAVLFSGCSGEEKKELTAPVRSVRTMVLGKGSDAVRSNFSGRLQSSREISLSFKVSGTIQKILVDIGDEVKKGDIVAELDPSSYTLDAQRSKAFLIEAESKLQNAKSEYSRVKRLYIGGNESKSALDNARAASDSATATVDAAKKALEIARLNLSYTRLIAENDCAIASKDAEVGENVSQGTQIFYTTCGSSLEVKLDIPEKVVSNIKKGMSARVTFPALEGKEFTGMVHEVGVASVKDGTLFPVTVLLTGSDFQELKAGMSADVAFSIARKKSVIVVPPFAVGEDRKGRFVFALDTTKPGFALVRRQPVTIGDVLQEGIEIKTGLIAKMRIVTAGVSVLREGMEVKFDDKQ